MITEKEDKRLVILYRKLFGQNKPTFEYLHPLLAVYELLYGEQNGITVERAWIDWLNQNPRHWEMSL